MKTGKTLVELAQEIQRQAAAKADYVAPVQALSVSASGRTTLVVEDRGEYDITANAHRQISSHLAIPADYYDRLHAGVTEVRDPYHPSRSLFESTVNALLQARPQGERRMTLVKCGVPGIGPRGRRIGTRQARQRRAQGTGFSLSQRIGVRVELHAVCEQLELIHAIGATFRAAELTAHLPGRDTRQRQRQADEQCKTNYAAGSGAAAGSYSSVRSAEPLENKAI